VLSSAKRCTPALELWIWSPQATPFIHQQFDCREVSDVHIVHLALPLADDRSIAFGESASPALYTCLLRDLILASVLCSALLLLLLFPLILNQTRSRNYGHIALRGQIPLSSPRRLLHASIPVSSTILFILHGTPRLTMLIRQFTNTARTRCPGWRSIPSPYIWVNPGSAGRKLCAPGSA